MRCVQPVVLKNSVIDVQSLFNDVRERVDQCLAQPHKNHRLWRGSAHKDRISDELNDLIHKLDEAQTAFDQAIYGKLEVLGTAKARSTHKHAYEDGDMGRVCYRPRGRGHHPKEAPAKHTKEHLEAHTHAHHGRPQGTPIPATKHVRPHPQEHGRNHAMAPPIAIPGSRHSKTNVHEH
ncbi:hypothetical protein WOLCODRAFT_143233, partial [Wolfiporia cocos MD-104 SS10]